MERIEEICFNWLQSLSHISALTIAEYSPCYPPVIGPVSLNNGQCLKGDIETTYTTETGVIKLKHQL